MYVYYTGKMTIYMYAYIIYSVHTCIIADDTQGLTQF